MGLGSFKAADLDQETKQECVERIEHAMKNCDDCNTDTTDEPRKMCHETLENVRHNLPVGI